MRPATQWTRRKFWRGLERLTPQAAEQFVAWATGVGECLVIPGCSCRGCVTVAREVKAARVMRLALQMIVAQCGSYDHGFGESIDRIQRTAEQALRECGK